MKTKEKVKEMLQFFAFASYPETTVTDSVYCPERDKIGWL